MTELELENYTGNLRITKICFDALSQMWPTDEYDPKIEAPNAKFYIGKIGKFSRGSYIFNHIQQCASIVITFENGEDVLVTEDDVEITTDRITPKEFLPEIKNNTVIPFTPLTQDEKDFADKLFLQLTMSCGGMHSDDMCDLFDQAVSVAMYRTVQHNLLWDRAWIKFQT